MKLLEHRIQVMRRILEANARRRESLKLHPKLAFLFFELTLPVGLNNAIITPVGVVADDQVVANARSLQAANLDLGALFPPEDTGRFTAFQDLSI